MNKRPLPESLVDSEPDPEQVHEQKKPKRVLTPEQRLRRNARAKELREEKKKLAMEAAKKAAEEAAKVVLTELPAEVFATHVANVLLLEDETLDAWQDLAMSCPAFYAALPSAAWRLLLTEKRTHVGSANSMNVSLIKRRALLEGATAEQLARLDLALDWTEAHDATLNVLGCLLCRLTDAAALQARVATVREYADRVSACCYRPSASVLTRLVTQGRLDVAMALRPLLGHDTSNYANAMRASMTQTGPPSEGDLALLRLFMVSPHGGPPEVSSTAIWQQVYQHADHPISLELRQHFVLVPANGLNRSAAPALDMDAVVHDLPRCQRHLSATRWRQYLKWLMTNLYYYTGHSLHLSTALPASLISALFAWPGSVKYYLDSVATPGPELVPALPAFIERHGLVVSKEMIPSEWRLKPHLAEWLGSLGMALPTARERFEKACESRLGDYHYSSSSRLATVMALLKDHGLVPADWT